ncbi:MAG: ATP-binding protein [Bacteriovoracaceae bacterium]|nr:ATP-binding protein [Bacteriovoracaceae bacterium]
MVSKTKIPRLLSSEIHAHLQRGKSILLLGPRQVGKTTLLKEIDAELTITLLNPRIRLEYEKNPEKLKFEALALNSPMPLIIIDEIQRVPVLMDIVQELIDDGQGQFILTGSSARKLKKQKNVNLLPGRVVSLRLDPFSMQEYQQTDIQQLLFYGSLPEIALTKSKKNKEIDLNSYVETYLEEEVRAEALVRELGPFARFLELAGMEAGRIIRHSSLAQELGVDPKTIANYYEILFDCLITERIQSITYSETRKKLVKSSRYLFFDMGVRRSAAQEGVRVTNERKGDLFKQFVGIELLRQLRQVNPMAKLKFWKDPDGPEVDWVIDYGDGLIPIEVKWSKNPTPSHGKHLRTFLKEYPKASCSYIICRCDNKQKLDKNLWAIPWQNIPSILPG